MFKELSAAPTIADLPLGATFPDAPYNQRLAELLARAEGDALPDQGELADLWELRSQLFSEIEAFKRLRRMKPFGRHLAERYDFELESPDRLSYPFKDRDHGRVGWEQQTYASNLETKAFEPIALDHDAPRLIVFASGRALSEENARLRHLSLEQRRDNARYIMGVQAHLVGSRLVPGYRERRAQVAAFAYDMVQSEFEVPAMRTQSILRPDSDYAVAQRATERVFGPIIADAEHGEDGLFLRREGRILGAARSPEDILRRLSGLVLVGCSIGCLVTLLMMRNLRALLAELGLPEELVERARTRPLVLNLGCTVPPPRDGVTRHLTALNRYDEFAMAGHDAQRTLELSAAHKTRLIADSELEGATARHSYTLVLDGPSAVTRGDDERYHFDPIKSHYGHSMKNYANGLKQRGFAALIGAALFEGPGFDFDDSVAKLTRQGMLQTDP
jgi:hypothetical protein